MKPSSLKILSLIGMFNYYFKQEYRYIESLITDSCPTLLHRYLPSTYIFKLLEKFCNDRSSCGDCELNDFYTIWNNEHCIVAIVAYFLDRVFIETREI